MSAAPDVLASGLAAAIERGLATALAADALGMDRFGALHGRRLRFTCLRPGFEHTWVITPDQVLVTAGDGGPADVTVTAELVPLMRLLLRPDLEPGDDVQVGKDAALLDAWRTALAGLAPDLAPLLEPLLGRDGAARADAVLGAGTRVLREVADAAAEGVTGISQRLASGDAPEAARRLADALRGLADDVRGRSER